MLFDNLLRNLSGLVLFLALLAASGCGPSRPGVPEPSPGETPVPEMSEVSPLEALSAPTSDWVTETLENLTLEEKVGQMISVRAYGYFQNDNTPRMRRLFDLVQNKKVGGICLFQGDIHTSALLVNRLQERAKVPLLVAADFEWGMAMRLRRSTRFPGGDGARRLTRHRARLRDGSRDRDGGALGRHPAGLRARRRREQQSREPRHQYPVVRRKSRRSSPRWPRPSRGVCSPRGCSPRRSISPATATPTSIRTSAFRSCGTAAAGWTAWSSSRSGPSSAPAWDR